MTYLLFEGYLTTALVPDNCRLALLPALWGPRGTSRSLRKLAELRVTRQEGNVHHVDGTGTYT